MLCLQGCFNQIVLHALTIQHVCTSNLAMSHHSGKSMGRVTSEHEDDFALAGQNPITKLTLAVEALSAKVERGFQDVSNRFSTYKVGDGTNDRLQRRCLG